MKNELQKVMGQAFERDFKSLMCVVNYVRPSTDGVYDPVNETYTGGTNAVSQPMEGLFRKVSRRLVDGDMIFNNSMVFTMLQSKSNITPRENDILIQWKDGITVNEYGVITSNGDVTIVDYGSITDPLVDVSEYDDIIADVWKIIKIENVSGVFYNMILEGI